MMSTVNHVESPRDCSSGARLPEWEPSMVKAQFRLTSLKLGQLQEIKDSQATAIRGEIANSLRNHDVAGARAKALELVREDALGDLLEALGMHLGFLLEHVNEIGAMSSEPLSPDLVGAASTIISAAPHVNSRDLDAVKDLLLRRLNGNIIAVHPSSPLFKTINGPLPGTPVINACLETIANDHAIGWSPVPQRTELSDILIDILSVQASSVVDLPKLRFLCRCGLPDKPAWLRPRIWKLLFGTLPVLKASWKKDIAKQRDSYYEFVRQFLEPVSHFPPLQPSNIADKALLDVCQLLANIPLPLLVDTLDSTKFPLPHTSQVRSSASNIPCSDNLEIRLAVLQAEGYQPHPDPAPGRFFGHLSHTALPITPGKEESATFEDSNVQFANEEHWSTLRRLLYLHTRINPGNVSPHISSLLVVLYMVMNQEAEQEDLAHVEADTFWLFEAILGEFSELGDSGGGNLWAKKLSERLRWADHELFDDLQMKGLDPALPHYSSQWLAPLLTQTLPVANVLTVWDALFSCPPRERTSSPKLDYLLDICSSMLIHARPTLFRLGGKSHPLPNIRDETSTPLCPPSPLPPWELKNAFVDGLSLLQHYPLAAASDIDGILQMAFDFNQKRREGKIHHDSGKRLTFGTRLKMTVWKGFTNQETSPSTSPDVSDEESAVEETMEGPNDKTNSREAGLTSRLVTSVWRGITNQSSMDVPPSPTTPVIPLNASIDDERGNFIGHEDESTKIPEAEESSSSLWKYARKLKVAATAVRGNRQTMPTTTSQIISEKLSPLSNPLLSLSSSTQGKECQSGAVENGSLSQGKECDSSLPVRSSHLLPPLISSKSGNAESPEQEIPREESFLDNIHSSLASLTKGKASPPSEKPLPRPLLLTSKSVISSSTRPKSVASRVMTFDRSGPSDVNRVKAHVLHGSQSSVSSLSPSESSPASTHLREWDSDTPTISRRVPLNRQAISPLAPASRILHRRPMSASSTASSASFPSTPWSSISDTRNWRSVNAAVSPPLNLSPQFPSPAQDLCSQGTNDNTLPIKTKTNEMTSILENGSYSTNTPKQSFILPPEGNSSRGRFRAKRRRSRPSTLNVDLDDSEHQVERQIMHPAYLDIERLPECQDSVNTPRAATFEGHEPSSEIQGSLGSFQYVLGGSGRVKPSATQRTPNWLSEYETKWYTESSADEGDDEGYGDLLSSYESEDSPVSLR